jgi:hypothetical protein
MPSNVLLANAYIMLAALAPTSTAAAAANVHPAHAVRAPRPARHVAHVAPPLAVTRSSARLRAERASGGEVTLTLV